MVNLFDIMQAAQGGQAFENLAKQFNLSIAQSQAAVEALLPAFSLGLKRKVEEPAELPNLFAMMGGMPGTAFENPFAAFTQQAIQQGNELVASIFGSKEMSKAIAAQAAAVSGVTTQVVQAMLPVLAAILIAGLGRTAATQPQFQTIFTQMMSGTAGGAGDFFGAMFGTQDRPTPQVQPNPNGGGLLGALLGSLLQQGTQQAGQAAPRQTPDPSPTDALSQMFETGRQVQQAQIDGMKAIFDAFLPKKPGET
jgi:hypothetical protein